MGCPVCQQPVPTNEAVCYGGRHEDCYINTQANLPTMPPIPRVVRDTKFAVNYCIEVMDPRLVENGKERHRRKLQAQGKQPRAKGAYT